MDEPLLPRDLPQDWFQQLGNLFIDQLSTDLHRYALTAHGKRLWVTRPDFPLYDLRLNPDPPAPPNFKEARQLYNNPAICYTLPPSRRENGNLAFLTASSGWWLKESWDEWKASCRGWDGKLPFGVVSLDHVDYQYLHFEEWIGLGAKSSLALGEAERAILQERDIYALIRQHEQLCDQLSERVKGPLDPAEAKLLQEERYRRINTHRVLSPVFRAVFILCGERQTKDRRVLVVLTGNNDHLKGPSPTFASIPQNEILARRSHNVVEVPITTAVRFLRHLDNEEEKANEVLRRTTEARIQDLAVSLRLEATETLTKWPRPSGDWILDLAVEAAMKKVLSRRT